jgi:hypothetical protein
LLFKKCSVRSRPTSEQNTARLRLRI